MLQSLVHYSLHFLVIGIIAYFYDKKNWKKAWVILALTMLVDADHLLANPIFEADRCSINFHLFHTYWAIVVYILGAIFTQHKTVKLVCIGLCFHMLTDGLDCLWNNFS